MKNYIAYDLSRKIWMEARHKRKVYKEKAPHWCGYYFKSHGDYAKRLTRRKKHAGYKTYPTFKKIDNNRRLRRLLKNPEQLISNGCSYKKIFEYWWDID